MHGILILLLNLNSLISLSLSHRHLLIIVMSSDLDTHPGNSCVIVCVKPEITLPSRKTGLLLRFEKLTTYLEINTQADSISGYISLCRFYLIFSIYRNFL